MKIKSSTSFLALLCVSVLLFLGSTSAQKNDSSKRNSKSISTKKATPTPTPTATTTLAGSYTLINPSSARATVKNAIEYAVKGMSHEKEARDKLEKTNLPPPQRITIWYSVLDFSIETDQSGLIQTPSNGSSKPWTNKYNDTYQVSTKWVNRDLERTFESGRGRRFNTYSLSVDGRTMTMKVTAETKGFLTPSFKHPFNYHLEYRRN